MGFRSFEFKFNDMVDDTEIEPATPTMSMPNLGFMDLTSPGSTLLL